MYFPTTSISPMWSKPLAFHAPGIEGPVCVTSCKSSSVLHNEFVPEKIHPPGIRATPWSCNGGIACWPVSTTGLTTRGNVVVVTVVVLGAACRLELEQPPTTSATDIAQATLRTDDFGIERTVANATTVDLVRSSP